MPSEKSRNDRFVLGGFICFGLLAIAVGFLNLHRVINIKPPIPPSAQKNQSAANAELEERLRLASSDTDGDGLSDADEFGRIGTSPYLADSDSDGKTDKEEVDAGEDPNCPAGTSCMPSEAPSKPSAAPHEGDMSGMSGANTDDFINELFRSVGQTGAPANAVALPAPDNKSGNKIVAPTFDAAAFISALPSTPSEVRQYLEKGGFPAERLKQLDDAALMSVWSQIVMDMQKAAVAAPK